MKNESIACFHALPMESVPTLHPQKKNKDDQTESPSSPVKDTFTRSLPEKFLLLKYGKNTYTKNAQEGEFDFSQEDADTLIREFTRRGKDLVIDFEHQSIGGEKAPAAGWIKGLEKNDLGLAAIVKYWTKEAEQLLLNGQYRYFSPVLYFSDDGEHILSLHSVALTNHPALHNIPPLAANDLTVKNHRETEKNLKETQSASAGSKLPVQEQALLQKENSLTLLKDLEEKEKEKMEFFSRHDLHSFADADQLLEQAKNILKKEKLSMAFSQGLLTENMRSWAEELIEKTPALFDSWCKIAPKIVPDNLFTDQAEIESSPSSVDPREKEIYAMLGLLPSQNQK